MISLKKKEEAKNKEDDEKRKKNEELNKKRETCGKVLATGVGGDLLTATGDVIKPFCVAGWGASGFTNFGGMVADMVYENKMEK